MQKTAKKTALLTGNSNLLSSGLAGQMVAAGNATWLEGQTARQWNAQQAYQPTITWQDTTSNATYSSASNVLAGAGGTLAVRQHADVLERLSET